VCVPVLLAMWRLTGTAPANNDADRSFSSGHVPLSTRGGSSGNMSACPSARSVSARAKSPVMYSSPRSDTVQHQSGILVNEVRTKPPGFDEMAPSLRVLPHRAEGVQELVPNQGSESLSKLHQHEQQLRWQQLQEQRQAAVEEALENHCCRTEEALAAVTSFVRQRSARQELDAGVTNESNTSMDRKLREMSAELLAHAARINRLERSTLHSMQVQDRDRIATAVSDLQEKGAELTALFQQMRSDMEELRRNFDKLQEHLPSQVSPKSDAESGGTKATMQSVEHQLRDLVSELQKLQQEQRLQECREMERSAKLQVATSDGTATMIEELREEKAQVADMLDGVKREKLEVIAMMHSFAMDKDSAFQELEELRSTARCELAPIHETPSPAAVATVSGVQHNDCRRGIDNQTHTMNARLLSAPAWLTSHSAAQSMASVVPQQPSPIMGATVVSAAQASMPVQAATSARLQVGLVTSPPAPGPRHTLAEMRTAQHNAEVVDKSPVRRFVSAGISPRFTDRIAQLPAWTPAQDIHSVWNFR